MRNSTSPYYKDTLDQNETISIHRHNHFNHRYDPKYDPKTCVAHATFQGLLAFAWVAFGRASVQNGWPLCFLLSYGGLKGALEQHTAAISRYLTAKKLQKLDKNSL